MTVPFPNIIPTSSVFIPGSIEVVEASLFQTDIYKTGLGNIPHGSTLQLEYANIDDSDALLFLRAYRNCYNRLYPLTLNSSVVAGITNPALAARILAPVGLKWFFKEGPVVESVFIETSAFSLTLEALILSNL